jgi:hypothetical protein
METKDAKGLGTFTNESAGPRQIKGLKEAASALQRTIREHVELTGVRGGREDRCVLWSQFGGPDNARARELWNGVGERFAWTITKANFQEIERALLEALPLAQAGRPVIDNRRDPAEDAVLQAKIAERNAEDKRRQEAVDAARAAVVAKRPPGAAALIVAELDEDTSDSMTDYFAHTTARCVAIGWRTGSREDFRQLRRAATGFPETAHLGPDAPDAVEHRENYSMGSGNYLKDGGSHSSGWKVRSWGINADGTLERGGWHVLEDALPAPQTPAPDAPGTPLGDSSSGRGFNILAATNRRGPFSLVVLADRVERPEFERLRDSAKAAGGWYSRAFGKQPGGFGFDLHASARRWAEEEFADVGTSEEVPTCEGCGDAVPTDAPQETHCPPCRNPHDGEPEGPFLDDAATLARGREARRLEDLADRVATEVAAKRAPLSQNWTARRARIKDGQRADADRLERVERGLRALARALRENRLPGVLAACLTRAAVERTLNPWDKDPRAVAKREALEALIAGGLDEGTRAVDAARIEADRLRKAEDEFRGVKIPGFFPTPPAVAARLFELLQVEPGMSLLEPSAGLGHLAEIARTAGADVTCVERVRSLAEVLERKGFRTVCGDFLTDSVLVGFPAEFDRIAMNPPFERGADVEHVRRAVDYLKPGGQLVAVVTPRGAEELRGEFDCDLWALPEGSFQGADVYRSTGVRTCLVLIQEGGAA